MSRWIPLLLALGLLLGARAAVAAPCPGQPPLNLPALAIPAELVSEPGRQLYEELAAAYKDGKECLVTGAIDWAVANRMQDYLEGTEIDQLIGAWLYLGAAVVRRKEDLIKEAEKLFELIKVQMPLEGVAQDLANAVQERIWEVRAPSDTGDIKSSEAGVQVVALQKVGELQREVDTWWGEHRDQPVLLEFTLYDPRAGGLELRVRGATLRIERGGELRIEGIVDQAVPTTFERSLWPTGRWLTGAQGKNTLLVALDGATMVFSLNDATSPTFVLAANQAGATSLGLKAARGMRIDAFAIRAAE